MLFRFIYKKKEENGNTKTYILGIPVNAKTNRGTFIKYSYLFSIFQLWAYDYKVEYYLFKIKVYQKFLMEKYLIENQRKQDVIMDILNNKLELIKNEIIIKNNAKVKTLIQCQQLHKETFGIYKNSFKGKDVVLVASGPTAKFHKAKDDVIYVGVNNACLLDNVKLDYLFCQDFYMNEEKKNAIVNYRKGFCQKFFGRIPDLRYENCLKSNEAKHVRRCPKKLIIEANAKEYYIQDEYENSFALDIEKEPLTPSGIVFSAMQFILHAHPKRIYLVGCDCSSGFFYKSDITFDVTYQINTWERVKKYMEHLYPDIEVISLDPVGLRGLFRDEYSENYLESLSEEERSCISV